MLRRRRVIGNELFTNESSYFDSVMFRTSANVPLTLAADSHIRRLGLLDLSIQREQSPVLNMSQPSFLLKIAVLCDILGKVSVVPEEVE
jgi:hypothetical protein